MQEWINKYIGKKIQTFRNERGVSQETLGKEIDLSRASIANFEAGTQSISIADLYNAALTLEKDVDNFLPSMEEIKKTRKTPEEIIMGDEKLEQAQRERLASIVKTLEEQNK
jgi:transcriptional regulator with XRE-family HTH domain